MDSHNPATCKTYFQTRSQAPTRTAAVPTTSGRATRRARPATCASCNASNSLFAPPGRQRSRSPQEATSSSTGTRTSGARRKTAATIYQAGWQHAARRSEPHGQQQHQVGPDADGRHARRLARRTDRPPEHGQRRSAHVHDDGRVDEPHLHADARSDVSRAGDLRAVGLQPAAAYGLAYQPEHESSSGAKHLRCEVGLSSVLTRRDLE